MGWTTNLSWLAGFLPSTVCLAKVFWFLKLHQVSTLLWVAAWDLLTTTRRRIQDWLMSLVLWIAFEQWKKGPWLFSVYREWNTTQLYRDYFINYCKDEYIGNPAFFHGFCCGPPIGLLFFFSKVSGSEVEKKVNLKWKSFLGEKTSLGTEAFASLQMRLSAWRKRKGFGFLWHRDTEPNGVALCLFPPVFFFRNHGKKWATF